MYIGLHVKYRYCCQILMKLEFSVQIFEKYLHIRLRENRPMGAELFHEDRRTDVQTDRHDEANSRF
jgi:hypothetical protein